MTGDEEFNKQYCVISEIESDAFHILTPHMMNYILNMKKGAGRITYMSFERNGQVQIAISDRCNFVIRTNETDVVALRERFARDIRYVTDIIDELLQSDTIYAQN